MGEPRPRPTMTGVGRLGSAALVLLAAGCTTDGSSRDNRRDDPLLGSGLRSGSPPTAVPTTSPNGGLPPPAYQPKPPLTAATPTSTAALAGGFQPLQGGNDLRIGSGSPTPGTPTSGIPQQPGYNDPRNNTPPAPPTGFSPVTPVPPPGAPANTPLPAPVAGQGGSSSLDQAYAAVATRNPLWTRMTYNGEAPSTCSR